MEPHAGGEITRLLARVDLLVRHVLHVGRADDVLAGELVTDRRAAVQADHDRADADADHQAARCDPGVDVELPIHHGPPLVLDVRSIIDLARYPAIGRSYWNRARASRRPAP
jgi:hypothetical protein